MPAAARRDDEPRPDRAEHRVATPYPELRRPDDPHGGYRPLPSEGREPAAHLAPDHRSDDLGPVRDYSVFQFFYLERNSRRPERDSGEQDAKGRGSPAKLLPAEESQQHDGEPTRDRTARSEVINYNKRREYLQIILIIKFFNYF